MNYKYIFITASIIGCTLAGYIIGLGMHDWYTYAYYGAAVGCAGMAYILADTPLMKAKIDRMEGK